MSSAADHASLWYLLWGFERFGHRWPETAFLALVLAPWVILLGLHVRRAHRREPGAIRIAGLYLYSRLMLDFALWGPIAGIATLTAAAWLARRRRGYASLPIMAALPMVLAAAGAVGAALFPDALTAHVLACWAMAATCFPHTPWTDADAGRTGSAPALRLLAGLAAGVAIEGLRPATFVPLTVLGITAWLAVAFELWRHRRAALAEGTSCAPRIATLLRAVAWGTTVLLTAVLLAEFYFRHVYDQSDANAELATSKRWTSRHVRFNSWHFRGPEIVPPAPDDDHLRIVVLGDSFAFGQGIAGEDGLLSSRLRAELEAQPPDGRPVQVFNLARRALTTADESAVFREFGLRLGPHVVVQVYMLNDINDGIVFPAINHPALEPWRSLTQASVGMEFLTWRGYDRWYRPGRGDPPRELALFFQNDVFARHAAHVAELIDAVRGAGAAHLAVVFPFLGTRQSWSEQQRAMGRIMSAFADQGVEALDVSTVFDATDPAFTVNRFDAHPNERVSWKLGPVLASCVRRLVGVRGAGAE